MNRYGAWQEQVDKIPPLPQNAHSYARTSRPTPSGGLPYPLDDSIPPHMPSPTPQLPGQGAQPYPQSPALGQAFSQPHAHARVDHGYPGHGHPPPQGHLLAQGYPQQHQQSHSHPLAQQHAQHVQQAQFIQHPQQHNQHTQHAQQQHSQHPQHPQHPGRLMHHASNPLLASHLNTHKQLLQRQGHRSQSHQRSESTGSTSSFKSIFGSDAKPAPKRHYIWESSAHADEQLTVNQFERTRSIAAQQPHDPRIQLDYAKKLVEAAGQLASKYSDPWTPTTMTADKRQEFKNRDVWIQTAQKITKKLVSRTNSPDATFFLASNYSSGGMGLDIDNVKAFELYNRAAKMDHAESCYRVAVSFEHGIGTRTDTDRALSWYKKAAPLNDTKSMYKLGMTYLNGGLNQRPNFREALMWLQRAADKADASAPHAVHELALIFENARAQFTQPPDLTRALECFQKAAALGYAPSQVRLGKAFEFGELGCSVDAGKSIEWYSAAAQSGDSDGDLGLCGWYWTGADGVLKASETEAFLLAEKSAQKQNPRGEFALGYFYQMGIGVAVDLQQARHFYTRASEKRHPHALQRLKELGAF